MEKEAVVVFQMKRVKILQRSTLDDALGVIDDRFLPVERSNRLILVHKWLGFCIFPRVQPSSSRTVSTPLCLAISRSIRQSVTARSFDFLYLFSRLKIGWDFYLTRSADIGNSKWCPDNSFDSNDETLCSATKQKERKEERMREWNNERKRQPTS